jgi:hypothetical protein
MLNPLSACAVLTGQSLLHGSCLTSLGSRGNHIDTARRTYWWRHLRLASRSDHHFGFDEDPTEVTHTRWIRASIGPEHPRTSSVRPRRCFRRRPPSGVLHRDGRELPERVGLSVRRFRSLGLKPVPRFALHTPSDETIRSKTSDFILTGILDSLVPTDVAIDVMASSGVGVRPHYALLARAVGPNVSGGEPRRPAGNLSRDGGRPDGWSPAHSEAHAGCPGRDRSGSGPREAVRRPSPIVWAAMCRR